MSPAREPSASRKPGSPAAARETKFAETDFSEVAADGSFFGYASVFGEADLSRDVVMPGAFAKSLLRRGASGVRMLFQHDPAAPIGVWEQIREDSRGLFVRGRLTPEVARAREVLALMRAGGIDGLSIGFRTVRARAEAKTGVRRLLEVDLWEISVVTFPMLPAARITAVKAAGAAGGLAMRCAGRRGPCRRHASRGGCQTRSATDFPAGETTCIWMSSLPLRRRARERPRST